MTPDQSAAIARTLIGAIQQVRHYGPNHPAAREGVTRFGALVRAALAPTGVLLLEAREQWLKIQSVSLSAEDQLADQLRTHLLSRRVQSLAISSEADGETLITLVRLLAQEPEELIAQGGLEDALQSAGARGITVGAPAAPSPAVAQADVYTAALETVGALVAEVERGDPLDIARVHLVVENLIEALEGDRRRLWPQIASRTHDELDPAHAVNTCALAVLVAQRLGLSRSLQLDIGVAALLHDIGLSVLPWHQRVAERTIEPYRPDWRHPAEGAYLLRHTGGRESLPLIVAAEHHLAASGGGAVLPHSRLVSLVDYVDAVTCGRASGQRRASPGGTLTRLLAGEGPRFDPVHVRMLVAVLHQASAEGFDPGRG